MRDTSARIADVPVEFRKEHLLDISTEKYLLANFLYLGAFAELQRTTTTFVISVLLPVPPSLHMFTRNSTVTTERISIKFGICVFCENCREIQIASKRETKNAYFT